VPKSQFERGWCLIVIVGVDGPTVSSARMGLEATKTGAAHDPI
jgi:hypothetical protein